MSVSIVSFRVVCTVTVKLSLFVRNIKESNWPQIGSL